jgi:hypothetical protein
MELQPLNGDNPLVGGGYLPLLKKSQLGFCCSQYDGKVIKSSMVPVTTKQLKIFDGFRSSPVNPNHRCQVVLVPGVQALGLYMGLQNNGKRTSPSKWWGIMHGLCHQFSGFPSHVPSAQF